MSYIVWRLHDSDLWLPTNCDTFAQAADAWLEIVQSGGRAEIMERVAITLTRQEQKTATPSSRGRKRGTQAESDAEKVRTALKAAPNGMSRTQLAVATGLPKTNVGATAAGFMKQGLVRSEQRPADDTNGPPSPGRDTVSVYFWQQED